MSWAEHTPLFATAGQLTTDDFAAIKAAGFATVVCNRPDFEGGSDQPTIDQVAAAAKMHGLEFDALPFSGAQLSPQIAEQFAQLIGAATKPVLAYCRTGMRSTAVYHMAVDLGCLQVQDLSYVPHD
jgi:sulfide:quinone oxidoreductase